MLCLSRRRILAMVLLSAASSSTRVESAPVTDRGPAVVATVQPVRPRPMMNFGGAVTVEVTFTITAQGTVDQVKIHRSTDPLLETPVLAAIKQWKFSPTVKNSQAVAVRARQSFTFDDAKAPPQPKRDLPATPTQPGDMIATAK